MANIWDSGAITTTLLTDLTYNMTNLDGRIDYLDHAIGEITATISSSNECGVSLTQEMEEVKNKNIILENDVIELKKIIARLNTRVNNLIAEKQINDYIKKNSYE